MNAKLFGGYYECLTLKEVTETIKATNGKMAVQLVSTGDGIFTLTLYGTFDGDAEAWGLLDADDEMFQDIAQYEATKKLYETLKANGSF